MQAIWIKLQMAIFKSFWIMNNCTLAEKFIDINTLNIMNTIFVQNDQKPCKYMDKIYN